MKQLGIVLFLNAAFCFPAAAAPLSSNARTVIPQAVQQIISVDYRELRDSPMASATVTKSAKPKRSPLNTISTTKSLPSTSPPSAAQR